MNDHGEAWFDEDAGTIGRLYAEILRLGREPQSIAELAAKLRLPLTSTKVLVDDGLLEFREPVPLDRDTDAADIGVLRALLKGIEAL
ncbi:DUF742 domain-containing protein [Nocardia asteroides]|uniref:DUF742 domain-containing protein n=1 Tax=Nocardia asteroides TaxID=1824 RepID=UPI001E5C2C07|nr:DUF742 domain-containing protein [Nocardia asteroides]UGT61360.1 DUF742 domain-containing protein [Nocardia asteroides]